MSVAEPQREIEKDVGPALSARFERLPYTKYQKKLVGILATCFTFDAIDLVILSFLLAPVSIDLGLSKTAAGFAGSACFAGMGIGATVAGWVADRFGRRGVLVSSMLLWGTATLATALSWNLESFMLFRFVTGIGLGAELPVAFALIAEFMPAVRRARVTGTVQLVSAGGTVLFNALSLAAVAIAGAVWGWRAMFVVMFLGAMFALYVRRQLPESPRWYASRRRVAEAEATMSAIESEVERAYGKPLPPPKRAGTARTVPARGSAFRELFTGGYARRTALALSMWLVIMLGYYAINTWVGKLLVDRGMSVTSSIVVGVLISVAGLPSAFLTGYLMDKVGRKAVLVGCLVLLSLAAFGYGHAATFALVVAAGFVMQFALVSVGTSLYAYTPELFPTRARATGMGTASTAGRISAIAGPLAVPPLVLAWGYTGTFVGFAVCFMTGALLVIILGPETKGRVLEEVSG